MTAFKPITPEDREIITSYLFRADNKDCDLSFANLCSWHFLHEASYAEIHRHLVLRFTTPEGSHEYYMPFGEDHSLGVIDELDACARQEGEALCLRGVLPETRQLLEQWYPTLFEYTTDRDYFDYIYKRQDLAELKGKHYQPKRNHINKFRKEYEYAYVPLTPERIPECLHFEAEWCIKHGYAENENIKNERKAMTYALEHFDALRLQGGVLLVEGKVEAFTFGAPINHDTFGVHFEKASVNIDGAYSMINREFAASLPEQYVYLNREEDLGLPGLRQAKLSYHPAMLLEKCKAVKK